VFTERDSAALAFLIFRRWGRDLAAATSAWRRLLGNSCTEDQFAALVSAGRDALVLPREEAARIVEALAEYEARPREADGSRDLSDGACTLPALRPLVRLATGG
jgi:hypothetical protein